MITLMDELEPEIELVVSDPNFHMACDKAIDEWNLTILGYPEVLDDNTGH